MRNILWQCITTTITRTYHKNYYIKSSNIVTVTRLSGMCIIKQYILIYIPVQMTYLCRWYYLSTYWYTHRTRTTNRYAYNMCKISMTHTSYFIRNDKYMWIWVYILYDLSMNVLLYHILHIRSGDICTNQHEIAKKRLSKINNVSA